MNRSSSYTGILKSIASNRLIDAMTDLQMFAIETDADSVNITIEGERRLYEQMLGFFVKDAFDPARETFRDELCRRLLGHADGLFVRALSPTPAHQYHVWRYRLKDGLSTLDADLNTLEGWPTGFGNLSPAEQESRLDRIFHGIWHSESLTPDHLRRITETAVDEAFSDGPGVVLVTALILRGLDKFSPEVWMALAGLYETQTHQIWQRALLGMLLILIRHNHRLHLYPIIGKRLELLAETDSFTTQFELAATQLIRTGDTEKVSKRIQEEILPEMMKLAPKIQQQMNLDQLINDEMGEEKNPEWEKFFEDSPGIYQKMEELNQLQQQGADLFINTFSQLKTYPFFRIAINWFIPFKASHPALVPGFIDEATNNRLLEFFDIFGQFPVMCNSDKYSFCFNMSGMPEQQRNMMIGALSGEVAEALKLQADQELISDTAGAAVFHQFTQDLYRFLRVHPARRETVDVFSDQSQLYECQPISRLLDQNPHLARRIGEFYFQSEHYQHAIELFARPEQEPQDNPELFQKIAYAWQMCGNLDLALEYYRKAELFDSNALWNLRKIAWCYHLQNKIPEAIATYREAERLDPDSVQIKLSIGNLCLQNNDWSGALNAYREAELLQPDRDKTLRPVAWCLFLQGDLEAAAHYYQRIFEGHPNHNDLLNYGHVRLALNEKTLAYTLYQQSLSHRQSSPEAFVESFVNDTPHLIRLGVSSADAAFMLDAIIQNGKR